ncbi:MAG: GNAT family N-acetyltransferase [Anaerolineae bacterium]
MTSATPPVVIRTARLLIRSWQPGDGPLLKQAIDANLAHLRPWMPWALDEPSAPDVVEARVQQFADRFARGEDWIYALFAPDGSQVLGGSGLHPRIGPSGLEIGYWLDAAHTGRGLASEATAALTCAAFTSRFVSCGIKPPAPNSPSWVPYSRASSPNNSSARALNAGGSVRICSDMVASCVLGQFCQLHSYSDTLFDLRLRGHRRAAAVGDPGQVRDARPRQAGLAQ